jgi:hypothetical protein
MGGLPLTAADARAGLGNRCAAPGSVLLLLALLPCCCAPAALLALLPCCAPACVCGQLERGGWGWCRELECEDGTHDAALRVSVRRTSTACARHTVCTLMSECTLTVLCPWDGGFMMSGHHETLMTTLMGDSYDHSPHAMPCHGRSDHDEDDENAEDATLEELLGAQVCAHAGRQAGGRASRKQQAAGSSSRTWRASRTGTRTAGGKGDPPTPTRGACARCRCGTRHAAPEFFNSTLSYVFSRSLHRPQPSDRASGVCRSSVSLLSLSFT